jgi:F-type H+-transporting ATPase subunit b
LGEIFGQLGINGPFLLAQIVNFVVLLFILRLVLYKPMLKMLEGRKQRIAEGLQAAEVARREAEAERAKLQEQLDRERRDAMDRIAAASKRGETLAAEIEAGARQEAQRLMADARDEARVRKSASSPRRRIRSLPWLCWLPKRCSVASWPTVRPRLRS